MSSKKPPPVINIDFMKMKEPVNSIMGGIFDTKRGKKLFGIIKIALFAIIAASIVILSLSNIITVPIIVISVASMIVTASTLLYLIEYARHSWRKKEKNYEKELINDTNKKDLNNSNKQETQDKSTNTDETYPPCNDIINPNLKTISNSGQQEIRANSK